MPALMADEVQMVFVPIFIALQHMKAGRLPGMGLEPGTLNSDEFAACYRSEIEKYARVVKGAGIPAMD